MYIRIECQRVLLLFYARVMPEAYMAGTGVR